ncbi:MAG: hypothetical protein WAM82_30545, partial [Thermoanaerobaculia bacterium]
MDAMIDARVRQAFELLRSTLESEDIAEPEAPWDPPAGPLLPRAADPTYLDWLGAGVLPAAELWERQPAAAVARTRPL